MDILRSDLKSKHAEHLSEKFAHTKAETERQTLASELQTVQKAVSDSNKEATTLRSELARMTNLVSLADQVSSSTTRTNCFGEARQ